MKKEQAFCIPFEIAKLMIARKRAALEKIIDGAVALSITDTKYSFLMIYSAIYYTVSALCGSPIFFLIKIMPCRRH